MSDESRRKSFLFDAVEIAALEDKADQQKITQSQYIRSLIRRDSNIDDVESVRTRRPHIQATEDEQAMLEYLCQLQMVLNLVARIAQCVDELSVSSNALEMMKIFEEVQQLNKLIRWHFAGAAYDNDEI